MNDAPYEIVLLKSRAIEVLKSLAGKTCALDFETTSLEPESGRVRLTNLMCDEWEHPIVFDHYFCGHFKDLIDYYIGPLWIVYNAKFELRWFDAYAPNKVGVLDVDFMAKAKLGGNPSSMAKMVKRDLKLDLDKDEQVSDWSRKQLTPSQYMYAATDADRTWQLFKYWKKELAKHPHGTTPYSMDTVWIQQEAVRPTMECEETGMVLDVGYHMKNIDKWNERHARAYRYVRKHTPERIIKNLNSNPQVSDFLKTQLGESVLRIWPKTDKRKELQLSRAVLKPIIRQMPYPFSRWLTSFLLFRYYNKYLSTYGMTLVRKQHLGGKIDYRLNIAQAATKRYSSSSINIQNLPRAAYVRNAFLPPDGYKYFVTADYSGIEIRVLAELSGDALLLQDAVYGNLHGSMAAEANSIEEEAFLTKLGEGDPTYKEMRSKAKAGTFRLTYGAGAGAVSDSLNSSVEYAEEFIRKWAARYKDAYGYRTKMFEIMANTGFLPMVDGSTVYVTKRDREMPVAANYPVQGAAALVMLAAMQRVWALRNHTISRERVRMVSTVHDEIILAVRDEDDIPAAKRLLADGMRMGWLDVFPDTTTDNLIESGAGERWGACK